MIESVVSASGNGIIFSRQCLKDITPDFYLAMVSCGEEAMQHHSYARVFTIDLNEWITNCVILYLTDLRGDDRRVESDRMDMPDYQLLVSRDNICL